MNIINKRLVWAEVILGLMNALSGGLHAQGLLDAGFEATAVVPGGFVRPASGAWLFSNDAGVVEPYAPPSSTEPLNTWSATLAPVEGLQYASTYAGADYIRQSVAFGAVGSYRLSVFAAAPKGTVTIPAVGTFTLEDAEFTFMFGGVPVGNTHVVPGGAGWNIYSADFTVPAAGNWLLGVRNTKATPYFINYDAFALVQVPEPMPAALGLLALACLAGLRATRQRRH